MRSARRLASDLPGHLAQNLLRVTSNSLVVLGADVELRHVLPPGAAGADAHAPLGVLGSLENALLDEALLPERLKATWSGIMYMYTKSGSPILPCC